MKTRKKNHANKTYKMNKSNKMKGGFLNWLRGSPENKELKEDLKNLLTHKETIRKTLQSMYDSAKDVKKFNENYVEFNKSVKNINELVQYINKHRTVTIAPKIPANANPANVKPASANPGVANAVGLIGAAAGAGVAIRDLTTNS